jgi:hypothetical protein
MTEIVPVVAAELLIKANKAIVNKRGKGDPTMTIIFAMGKEYPPEQLIATMYRLQAMQKLVLSGHGPAWVMNIKGKKYKMINEALFRAAAKAPLRFDPEAAIGEMAFNAEEFLQVALGESDTEGAA